MRLTFKNHHQIIAGISERSDGSMVWWNRLPVDAAVWQDRDDYFKRLGIKPERVVAGGMAHGVNVVKVGETEAGKYLLNTDALITNLPNLFLTVTVADCLPVYFYDATTGSIGIAHAGWRGLIGGILENVVAALGNQYGSKPTDLHIIIGPHICVRHYEVGKEVAAQFNEQNIERRGGSTYANLSGEAVTRLEKLGVKKIEVSQVCTYEDDKLFSARRDKTEPLEGMVAYVGIKKINYGYFARSYSIYKEKQEANL